jgi:hypothetical protein
MTDQVAGSRPDPGRPMLDLRWRTAAAPRGPVAATYARSPSDACRVLQLALGCVWLLDSILQFQAFMFGRGFAAMLRAAAPGNPVIIATPITWSARLIQQHDVSANAAFAAIQLAIALGIAWRPTLRLALGASVGWSLAVWWLGEGFGGLLTGTASPASGAPGAVILYALLAILLWPRRDRQVSFVAARAIGVRVARLAWLVIWGCLAVLALLPATSAPRALAAMVTRAAAGQPAWLAHLDLRIAALLSRNGPAAAIVLAVVLAIVAAGIYLPRAAIRAVLVLGIATAGALWLAQGLGGLLTGGGTDPGTAPLLALLALAYWPLPAAGATTGNLILRHPAGADRG